MREESCFSGTIEFYTPPRPPAYTPVAISLPRVDTSGQIGVSLVHAAAGRSSGHVLEFRDDGAFHKRVEVRPREFRRLLAALKAAFPAQLEAHHVVDIVKIGFIQVRRTVSRSAQDVLHIFRQLMLIPPVLESAILHKYMGLTQSEARTLTDLAKQLRTTFHQSEEVQAVISEEAKRIEERAHEHDFEFAEFVYSRYFMASRYLCSDPVRQPLLVYDHDMAMRLSMLKFPQRQRVVSGPGGHTYFRCRRQHKVWSLVDTYHNVLGQLVDLGTDPADNLARYAISRAFPACRVHQQRQSFQLLPSMLVEGDRKSQEVAVTAVSTCGAFACLGNIRARREMCAQRGAVSYTLTASDDGGFTFFLGHYQRKRHADAHVSVYAGQDLLAMVMLALALDLFVAAS